MPKTREEKLAQLEQLRQARRGKLPTATRTLGDTFTKDDIAPDATKEEWNAWVAVVWEDWSEAAFATAVGMWEADHDERGVFIKRDKKED